MLCLSIVFSLGCVDGNGRPVDWFIAIKQNNGYGGVYMDSNNKRFISMEQLTSATNPMQRILKPLYDDPKGEKYYSVMFNDELPNGQGSTAKAHSKGVLAFDPLLNTGYYLLHSTPGWPAAPDSEPFYDSKTYAQHFLCLSIDEDFLVQSGDAFYTTRPYIYVNTFPEEFAKSVSANFNSFVNQKYTTVPTMEEMNIQTLGGQVWKLYYKNREAQVEIWNEIAERIQSNMIVETWLRDTNMTPDCVSYSVQMISKVQFLDFAWKETQDHSKWGMAQNMQTVCIGDINFMTSQKNRGGSIVCIDDPLISSAFLIAVVELDPKLVCK